MPDPTFISVLPALLVLGVAILTRRPIESLIFGALVGLAMLHGTSLLPEFAATSLRVMTDDDVAWVILVCGFMGSLIALLLRAGGFAAFSDFLRARVQSASGVLMGTWIFGLLLFVDDYMNSLAAGTAMRELSKEHGVSPEKLAYVVDSTAAPVSVIVPFSTWSAFYTGLIVSSGMAGAGEGFGLYVESIPYMLYAWFAILLVPAVALGVIPEIGPMKSAENRAAQTERGVHPGVEPGPPDAGATEPKPGLEPGISLFVLPMVVLVAATFWFDRDFLSGIYCTLGGLLVVLVGLRMLDFEDAFDTVLRGFTSMIEPLAVVVASFIFKDVNDALGLPTYVVGVIEPIVSAELLPVAIFVSMAVLSFVTGSNWGIFAIVMPIVASLSHNLGADPALVIGATISASTFGSHACFYSDATVLTARATGCTPFDHALTQFPYALIAAAAAVLGYLALAWI
jgi:Na+/H+ antiporter NhaC